MVSLFDDFETDHAASSRSRVTVSELTREIKLLLEGEFPNFWVEGEISNFKRHSSGHHYFSLKDADAQINCVMWRGRNQSLLFRAEDGMKVLALGNVTVYEKQGRYQLDVIRMQPLGSGELQLAFEALKQRLHQEGLFDEACKQALPEFPETIGVVTSPTGAAIRDIISVLQRRFPAVRVLLAPVRVQGGGAAEEIAAAIQTLNEYGNIDVLIVGRGGGSMEDLWPFNEEIVARAIFESQIPVISAVGHEIDFAISDFAADQRAATPSAAAEMAVHDRTVLVHQLRQWQGQMQSQIQGQLSRARQEITSLTRNYGLRRAETLIREYRLQLDDQSRQMRHYQNRRLNEARNRVAQAESRLQALNPKAVLARGYSLTTRPDGKPVRSVDDVVINDSLCVHLHRGRIMSRVEQIESDAS